MENTDFELELWNHQNEMVVLGTLFSKPEEAGFTYIDAIKNSDEDLIFTNLVDFDMLFGHRNNLEG